MSTTFVVYFLLNVDGLKCFIDTGGCLLYCSVYRQCISCTLRVRLAIAFHSPPKMLAAIAERPEPDLIAQPEHSWRVLRVETGRELQAEQHLRLRNICCYLPTYTFTRRWIRHKPETVAKALFPSYLLASFGKHEFSRALNAPYVFDLLRFGHEDAVISTEEMQRIQTLSSLKAEPWHQIAEGDPIRVVSGPLAGTFGKLITHKGESSIVVEVTLLNRAIITKLNGWDIEKT